MDKISSYNISLTLEKLRSSFQQGTVPEELHEPLRALLQRITEYTVEKPVSIYLFSDDNNAEIRNLFGYVLARSLLRHVPSTLLVDCEFLDVGMSGVVPQKDALGFLDLLLYGSSLGVITQNTNGGVHVVGAGSFPVTKRMPFVISAFNEAARRLVGYSRCAIFTGPLNGDDGDVHPLVGAVDVPVFVRSTDYGHTSVVDPIEEQIASQWDTEVLSVRISTSTSSETVSEQFREVPQATEEELVPSAPDTSDVLQKEPEPVVPPESPRTEAFDSGMERRPPLPGPPPTERREPRREELEIEEEKPGMPYEERRYTSLIPRIATWLVGVIIVIFIVWWVQQERTNGEPAEVLTQDDTPVQTQSSPAQTQVGAEEAASAETGGADTETQETQTGAATVPVDTVPKAVEPDETAQPVDEAVTAEEQPQEEALDPEDILVMDDVNSRWSGQYIIHISSFRESAKAREESRYLAGRGFSSFIVYLDLGAKGKWYRVYAGPLETRDEARDLKKELDDTPRVRFTRITRVSGR